MSELRKVIGARRKARAAAHARGMGKGRNAALRGEDECKPALGRWHDINTPVHDRKGVEAGLQR